MFQQTITVYSSLKTKGSGSNPEDSIKEFWCNGSMKTNKKSNPDFRLENNLRVRFSGDQGYINHIALVIDASGSMAGISKEVVEVADNQVESLAKSSRHNDQETRFSVYTFDDNVNCIFYDKDVYRLPSLKGKYRLGGMTALASATMCAISDLEKTATLYGEHSFLLYILTDGEENASSPEDKRALKRKLASLPDNWTVILLAPNQQAIAAAKRIGFPADFIEKWDPTAKGVEELGRRLTTATESYMTLRAAGHAAKDLKKVFSLDSSSVSKALQSGDLNILPKGKYRELTVPVDRGLPNEKVEISDFVKGYYGLPYQKGDCYYQFVDRGRGKEKIQAGKRVAIRNKRTRDVYVGDIARKMIGLPDHQDVRMLPEEVPDFDIFVQSTSTNRFIKGGTDLLYIR